MEQNSLRPIRKVAISDKLWECFEQMSREMGNDRDGLISQALFQFARTNGYLKPGFSDPGSPAAPGPAPAEGERPKVGAPQVTPPAGRKEPSQKVPVPAPPARREAAPPRRETVAPAPPRPEPPPEPPDEDQARREVAERVLETAAELERSLKDKQADGAGAPARAAADGADKSLYLMAEDGSLDKVVKERFVIGRGKHCDFVINSGKVSREHAAIVKDGPEYFIEDLGSSNGTWFNKQRIRRRKIEDGDEYFICSEKLKCVVR